MRVFKWTLNNFEEIVSGIAMIVTIASISIGVFSRYVMRNPVMWSEEVAGIAFTWTVFIGASAAFKRKMHIGIDLLVKKFPPKIQMVLIILANIIIFGFFVFMVVVGTNFALYSVKQPTPILRIPNTYYLVSVPLAFMLMIIHQIRMFLTTVRTWFSKE